MGMTVSEQFSWREIGEYVVILEMETGNYWTLNETAGHIWKQIAEGREPDDITESLVAIYDVKPDEAAKDVGSAITEFRKKGMIA